MKPATLEGKTVFMESDPQFECPDSEPCHTDEDIRAAIEWLRTQGIEYRIMSLIEEAFKDVIIK